MSGPVAAWLPGGRLHLQHGPIDLIIGAEGPDRARAFAQAQARFQTVLTGLVEELPLLRRPVGPRSPIGEIARAMVAVVQPHTGFVTPMAAVAGAVADAVLDAMRTGNRLTKSYVNNGGDIAFHIGPLEAFTAMGATGKISFRHVDPVRGLATSGWRGRSHSLGIADAVTVAAPTAAMADVAATLIANAVDLPGHPSVRRVPARELSPDSDLGDRKVTVEVGALTATETARALERGAAFAQDLARRGLITQAVLLLNHEAKVIEGALCDA